MEQISDIATDHNVTNLTLKLFSNFVFRKLSPKILVSFLRFLTFSTAFVDKSSAYQDFILSLRNNLRICSVNVGSFTQLTVILSKQNNCIQKQTFEVGFNLPKRNIST